MPDDEGEAPAEAGFFGAITSVIGNSLSYVADSVNRRVHMGAVTAGCGCMGYTLVHD